MWVPFLLCESSTLQLRVPSLAAELPPGVESEQKCKEGLYDR